MISLTEIHESRGGAPVALACGAQAAGGARVMAVGTGEGSSLSRVAAEASEAGASVLVRCCRGALCASGERVGVGMCLIWDELEPARVEESPMQAIAVVAPSAGDCHSGAVFGRDSEVGRSFDDVAVAWLSGDDDALASRVAELLARCAGEGLGQGGRATRRRIAYGARGAMDGSLAEPLTIPQLADACSTSPTVLKESFRDEFGLPVYEWYRRLRMLRASELLCEGAAAVGEVARKVGYANPSKFARAFSDCMGASPSVYRQA